MSLNYKFFFEIARVLFSVRLARLFHRDIHRLSTKIRIDSQGFPLYILGTSKNTLDIVFF